MPLRAACCHRGGRPVACTRRRRPDAALPGGIAEAARPAAAPAAPAAGSGGSRRTGSGMAAPQRSGTVPDRPCDGDHANRLPRTVGRWPRGQGPDAPSRQTTPLVTQEAAVGPGLGGGSRRGTPPRRDGRTRTCSTAAAGDRSSLGLVDDRLEVRRGPPGRSPRPRPRPSAAPPARRRCRPGSTEKIARAAVGRRRRRAASRDAGRSMPPGSCGRRSRARRRGPSPPGGRAARHSSRGSMFFSTGPLVLRVGLVASAHVCSTTSPSSWVTR